jgi:tetratricopeptide (TPR) repeat protein
VRGLLDGSAAVAYEVAVHARPGFTPYRDVRVFRNDPRIRFRGRVHPAIRPSIDALDRSRRVAVADTEALAIGWRAFDRDHLAEYRRELSRLRATCADEPGRVFPWCHVARICAADGRSRLADEAWRSAVQAARSKPHSAAGDCVAWIGAIQWRWDRGGAAELLCEALAHFPRNPRLQWLDAQLALREGRLEDAAIVCERLIDRGRTGDFDDAISCDQRIFTSLAAAALATCHLRQGRHREARLWFERAALHDPECVEYRVKAAFCATLDGSDDSPSARRVSAPPAAPRRPAPPVMPKPYLYIHIPRTGGVTMAAILERLRIEMGPCPSAPPMAAHD